MEEGIVERRVPSRCPFCWRIDEVEWQEFKVVAAEPFYVDEKRERRRSLGEDFVMVTCTRCDEEIREEDVRGDASDADAV